MEKIKHLISEHLLDKENLFIVDVTLSSSGGLKVVIDGDEGVMVSDCISLNKYLRKHLEEEDYSIEITSFGAENPLKLKRQYAKNIGRVLDVQTLEGTCFKGVLQGLDDKGVEVVCKIKNPKKQESKKKVVLENKKLHWEEIKQTKVCVKF